MVTLQVDDSVLGTTGTHVESRSSPRQSPAFPPPILWGWSCTLNKGWAGRLSTLAFVIAEPTSVGAGS